MRELGIVTASDFKIDIAFGLLPNRGGSPIYLDETYYHVDVTL